MERLNNWVGWYKRKLKEVDETLVDSRLRMLERLYRISEKNKNCGVTITRTGVINAVNYPVEIVKCGFWHKLPLFYHFCGAPTQMMKISDFHIYSFTKDLLPSSLYNLAFMKGPNCTP